MDNNLIAGGIDKNVYHPPLIAYFSHPEGKDIWQSTHAL